MIEIHPCIQADSRAIMNKIWIIGGVAFAVLVGIPFITRASNATQNVFIRSGVAGVPELIQGRIQIPVSVEVANFSGISASVNNMFAAIYYQNSKNERTLAARSTQQYALNLPSGRTVNQTMQFQLDPFDMVDIIASKVTKFEVEVTFDFANIQQKKSVPVDISGIMSRIRNFVPFNLLGAKLS